MTIEPLPLAVIEALFPVPPVLALPIAIAPIPVAVTVELDAPVVCASPIATVPVLLLFIVAVPVPDDGPIAAPEQCEATPLASIVELSPAEYPHRYDPSPVERIDPLRQAPPTKDAVLVASISASFALSRAMCPSSMEPAPDDVSVDAPAPAVAAVTDPISTDPAPVPEVIVTVSGVELASDTSTAPERNEPIPEAVTLVVARPRK
jgi:hypothetical protein